MPCDSSHMEANAFEIELSRIHCVLDELDGKTTKREWWDGYHPKAYCRTISREDADYFINLLCTKLKNVDVRSLSLEAQMWWRDHQEDDNRKEKIRLEQAKKARIMERAISKLTEEEKIALGITSPE